METSTATFVRAPRAHEKFSRTEPTLDAGIVEDAARDFFDRALGRVDHGNGITAEKRFGRAQLVGDLLTGSITAFGPPFVTNLLESFRLDGQGIKLATVRFQALRQLSRLEVVLGERIVGGEH